MTDDQIQLAFDDWWKESFPMAPANKQAAASHIAFASHVLALSELFREYTTHNEAN